VTVWLPWVIRAVWQAEQFIPIHCSSSPWPSNQSSWVKLSGRSSRRSMAKPIGSLVPEEVVRGRKRKLAICASSRKGLSLPGCSSACIQLHGISRDPWLPSYQSRRCSADQP
jgi:hypothetical protein